MTSHCKESKGAGRHAFRFNPWEVCFQGMPEEVWVALARVCSADQSVGWGIAREAESPVPPMSLLDRDIVLFEADDAAGIPTVAYIESERPSTSANVIAYLGSPDACPLLPSSADYFTTGDLTSLLNFIAGYCREKAPRPPLHGLVLAGGQSSRMGRDKAALEYGGEPQLARAVDLLKPFCADVSVSTRQDQSGGELYRSFRTLSDAFIGFGPLGGILTALKSRPDAAWLVLGCDLPFVTPAVVGHLVKQRNPVKLATAYRSETEGLPEPLCAIYEPKSVYRLMAFLARGYHCPRKVLLNSDSHLLDLDTPGALANINHPDEYEAALRALSQDR